MSNLGHRALALLVTALVGVSVVLVPSAISSPATASARAETGTVSGTVKVAGTGTSTRIHTQAQVQRLDGASWKVVENAYTDYFGAYVSEPLPVGTYRIEFTNLDFLTQLSAPFSVTSGASLVVDATLEAGASIRGRFTVPAGEPSTNLWVRVFARTADATWIQVDDTLVEPDGNYHVGGLSGGDYTVGFGDFKNYYAPEFFDNVATIGQATILTVPPNGNTTGIDVTLSTQALPQPPPATPAVTSVSVSRRVRVVGTMRVGQRVRAKIGTVSPADATVRYRWLLDGRRIKSAKARSLRLKPAMRGHFVSVRTSATAPGLTRWTKDSRLKLVRPARAR